MKLELDIREEKELEQTIASELETEDKTLAEVLDEDTTGNDGKSGSGNIDEVKQEIPQA